MQPSATSYGNFTISKKIVLIGGGANPLKQNNTPTKTGGIQLDNGSSGTIIMGFYIDGTNHNYCIKSIVDSIKNILICNCHIYNWGIITAKGISSWIVEGCVFSGYAYAMDIGSCNDILFQNNVCSASGAGAGSGSLNFQSGSISNVIIRNNIWISKGGANVFSPSFNISSLLIENNIFFRNNIDLTNLNGCQWHNNCFYLTNTWIGNSGSNTGNIQNNPQFVNFPATGDYFSFGYDFHLSSGSPCIGTGTGGTDIGVYGGDGRFNPGIVPPVPQIMSINFKNTAVPAGGKLQFEVIIEKQK